MNVLDAQSIVYLAMIVFFLFGLVLYFIFVRGR